MLTETGTTTPTREQLSAERWSADEALPARVYPHAIEPNDATRNRQRAGDDFYFGDYRVFPTHSKSGAHHWWVIDWRLEGMRTIDDDGTATVRSGASFEEVTRDFVRLFAE